MTQTQQCDPRLAQNREILNRPREIHYMNENWSINEIILCMYV